MNDIRFNKGSATFKESVTFVKVDRRVLGMKIDALSERDDVYQHFFKYPASQAVITEVLYYSKAFKLDSLFGLSPAGGG